jgi:hypothetical protein
VPPPATTFSVARHIFRQCLFIPHDCEGRQHDALAAHEPVPRFSSTVQGPPQRPPRLAHEGAAQQTLVAPQMPASPSIDSPVLHVVVDATQCPPISLQYGENGTQHTSLAFAHAFCTAALSAAHWSVGAEQVPLSAAHRLPSLPPASVPGSGTQHLSLPPHSES